jgi:hypothetical protein
MCEEVSVVAYKAGRTPSLIRSKACAQFKWDTIIINLDCEARNVSLRAVQTSFIVVQLGDKGRSEWLVNVVMVDGLQPLYCIENVRVMG